MIQLLLDKGCTINVTDPEALENVKSHLMIESITLIHLIKPLKIVMPFY